MDQRKIKWEKRQKNIGSCERERDGEYIYIIFLYLFYVFLFFIFDGGRGILDSVCLFLFLL